MNLNSTVRLTSDGTVRRVDLTYDVQATDIVQVYFNDDEIFTGWTLQRNTTPQRVDFDEYIPAGTLVLIRRYTDMREIPHLFHFTGNARGGAEFNAKNLDDNFDKIKRAAQDAMDSFELIGINLEAAANASDSADAAAASAALANTRANTASNQAQLATTKAQEATTEANKARTAANDAEAAKSHVAANALAAQNAEALAEQHRDDALAARNAANTSQTAAAGSASAAAASANTASTQAQTATAQANAASTSATLASNKAGEAVSFANSAGVSATQAAQSALEGAGYRDKAQQWAEHPLDTPVEANKFSAKHWATKAEQLVVDVAKTFTEDTVEVSFTGDGTATNKLKANIGLLDWNKLRSVPTVFPTDWDNLAGKPSVYPSAWANVANKPSTYPTTWEQVASKPQLALASHRHDWVDIDNLPATFPSAWSQVSGKPNTYPPTLGTTSTTAKAGNWLPSWGDVANKPTTFAPIIGTTAATAKAGNWRPNWTDIIGVPDAPFAPAAARIDIGGWGIPSFGENIDYDIVNPTVHSVVPRFGYVELQMNIAFNYWGRQAIGSNTLARFRLYLTQASPSGAIVPAPEVMDVNFHITGSNLDADDRMIVMRAVWSGLSKSTRYYIHLTVNSLGGTGNKSIRTGHVIAIV